MGVPIKPDGPSNCPGNCSKSALPICSLNLRLGPLDLRLDPVGPVMAPSAGSVSDILNPLVFLRLPAADAIASGSLL